MLCLALQFGFLFARLSPPFEFSNPKASVVILAIHLRRNVPQIANSVVVSDTIDMVNNPSRVAPRNYLPDYAMRHVGCFLMGTGANNLAATTANMDLAIASPLRVADNKIRALARTVKPTVSFIIPQPRQDYVNRRKGTAKPLYPRLIEASWPICFNAFKHRHFFAPQPSLVPIL